MRRRSGNVARGGVLAVALLSLLAWSPALAAPYRACTVDDGRLREASGAVASGRGDGVWFSHNDSGNASRAVALDEQCRVLAEVGWGLQAVDLEDVDRAVVDGRPSLFFADTGDNARTRSSVTVVRVPVPTAPWPDAVEGVVFPLVHPGGPADVETLLVAPDGRSAVLVEKTSGTARVWAADLSVPGRSTTLSLLGHVRLPDGSSTARQVTSGRVSPDSSRVALRTYEDVVVWRMPPTGSFVSRVATALGGDGRRLAVPAQSQGEALDWDREGLRLVSEGRPADVVRVPEADVPWPASTARRVRRG